MSLDSPRKTIVHRKPTPSITSQMDIRKFVKENGNKEKPAVETNGKPEIAKERPESGESNGETKTPLKKISLVKRPANQEERKVDVEKESEVEKSDVVTSILSPTHLDRQSSQSAHSSGEKIPSSSLLQGPEKLEEKFSPNHLCLQMS